MSEPTPSLLQQITDALKVAPRPFTHPQYIEGVLYLTEEQWKYFLNDYYRSIPSDTPTSWIYQHHDKGSIWGIPIHILKSGIPFTLPDGRVIIHSTHLADVYIYTPPEEPQFTYAYKFSPLDQY